jgi:hypothetical protein
VVLLLLLLLLWNAAGARFQVVALTRGYASSTVVAF